MTTFNNIDDLLRILDENPELLDAVRARVLTRELITLPETVARLADRVDQIAVRLDQLIERVDQLASRVDQLASRMDQMASRMDQLVESQERLENNMGSIRTQMGDIRGRIVYDIARDEAPLLASDLGLTYVATLTRRDLMNLTENIDTDTIERDDLRSFHRADLVFQATNQSGETNYVAVEASFTVNGRDTHRARRNARYLTRFTGSPAIPAVAGVVIDHHIRDAVTSEHLFWYAIPMGDLQPE